MYDTDTFDRNAAAILVLSTGISLTALIGTASRASILGLAVGIISAATVNKNACHTLSNLRALAGPILSVIIAIIFEYINNFKLTGRFISAVQQGAFGYRLKSWSVSLQGLIEYPVFGIGLGQHISYIGASRGITPHNTFILIASGTGLLGIFVLIWFGIMLLRRSILIITDYETHYLSLYIGFFISSAIFALFHDINNFRSFWVATGLLTASVCGRDQLDIH
jgi:hypothetical protein